MKKLLAIVIAFFQFSAVADILVGQTSGFTGPAAAGVKENTDGALLWLDAVNAKGGVNGQKIKLISLDDAFDPKQSAVNAQKLIDEQVVALFLNRGTPHTEAFLPLLEKHGVPLIGPSTGAMILHQPVKKYVFNVRSTYQQEAQKTIEQLHSMTLTRLAVIHADDSFGADGLEGAQKGFQSVNLKPSLVLKADRSKPDYAQLIPQLIQSNSQAVLWIGSAAGVAEGVKALRQAGSSMQVATLSNNASTGFIKALGDKAHGVIVSQVFPNERNLSYPMVAEAQALAKAKGLGNLSPAMLEGFAAAKVLVEALRRAGAKPTRSSVLAGLESIKAFDLGGLKLSYSSSSHTGLDFTEISVITQDGRFKR
jgi:branched-chain amino acid transport system substrate-binding protein